MSRLEFKQASIAKQVFNTSDEEVLEALKTRLHQMSYWTK